MDTEYSGDEIQKLCLDQKYSVKKIGPLMTNKLQQRLGEIRAAANLQVLKQLPGPRCHGLENNRDGQFAVDLKHPHRLVFIPLWEDVQRTMSLVKKVIIKEVTDYHKK